MGELDRAGAPEARKTTVWRLTGSAPSALSLCSGFGAAALVAAVAVALAAGHVPAPLLGVALGLYLAGLGYLVVYRPLCAHNASTRWRDVMPCYLSVQDRDLRILETNDLFRQDLGDKIGEHCYRAYKQRASPCPGCPVLQTFEDGQTHTGEETVITKNGEVANVVVTSTPLHDAQGRVQAVMEMSTNITEVKTLRQELERHRERQQQLFDIVPCYITVHDRDYRIIESNALFRRDFDDDLGQHCYRAYKGRDGLCPDCPVEKTFLDGEIHSSEETVRTRDGLQAHVMVHSMPVHDETGEIVAVMEVSTNITKVKELQRQLAMVGLAVTGMAHRIKNVLMGLEGGIFVVNTGFEMKEEGTVQEGWEMVQRNVHKISRIARDLLFCSKERVPKLVDGVSPRAVAREVHALFRDRMAQEKIALELELGEGDDRGRYDAEALHNLMANLVGNAFDTCRFDPRAEEKQHRVTLRCMQDGDGACIIEVADNGAGIAKEDQDRIFESFFSTKGTEGTGLGLFVVQKVVHEHGGQLSFESREGEGTTFRITFPRRGAAPVEP